MQHLSKVLIIGGGFAGMSAAIELRKHGIAVDLIEIDAGWRSYGAGLTLGGAALRALGTVGVLTAVLKQGRGADGADLFTASGHHIASLPTPRIAGPDVPGGGAIMRPVLAAILADATRAAGVNVRLGTWATAMTQDDHGVNVTLSDAQSYRYDLVIGADGLYSKTRAFVAPDAPAPRFTGQGVWRAVLPRGDVERAAMFMGQTIKAGVNPVSDDNLYLFVTEQRASNTHLSDEQLLPLLVNMLKEFSAPVITRVREQLSEESSIVYRPLEAILLQKPWSRGRVVLVGDAVHATTPHLAAGAGMGIEDAVALVQELTRAPSISAGLVAYQDRRFERCRMVVENSLRLGEIEITGGSKEEHAMLMRDSMTALAQPF